MEKCNQRNDTLSFFRALRTTINTYRVPQSSFDEYFLNFFLKIGKTKQKRTKQKHKQTKNKKQNKKNKQTDKQKQNKTKNKKRRKFLKHV